MQSNTKKSRISTVYTVTPRQLSSTCFPRGSSEPIQYSEDEDFKFQIVDWYSQDIDTGNDSNNFGNGNDSDGSDNEGGGYESRKEEREYVIRLFGVNKNGHSVSCAISGFNPFFYIKVPDKWNETVVRQFIKENITHTVRSKTKYTPDGQSYLDKVYVPKNYCVKDKSEGGGGDSDEVDYWCTYESALLRWKIVMKHDLNAGFTGIPAKKFKFVKLVFKTQDAMKQCFYLLRKIKDKFNISIYEANLGKKIFQPRFVGR
jgi:hypothetical protein